MTESRRPSCRWDACLTVLLTLLLLIACQGPAEETGMETVGDPEPVAPQGAQRYMADLAPMNGDWGGGASGWASIVVEENQLILEVEATGLAPGAMHLVHYHGFADGRDATCPTVEQDTNGDQVIDLLETEASSGTTLVPFHDDPASLEILAETYPMADEEGNLAYEQTVDRAQLEAMLAERHGIEELALERRVIFLHGVAEEVDLPATVESLPDVPARTTLPVACGELTRLTETSGG